MKIADIIDIAINEHLWNGRYDCKSSKRRHSCVAISLVESPTARLVEFLNNLGCDTGDEYLFLEFGSLVKRQYARALWLTWAAMIAREEETK